MLAIFQRCMVVIWETYLVHVSPLSHASNAFKCARFNGNSKQRHLFNSGPGRRGQKQCLARGTQYAGAVTTHAPSRWRAAADISNVLAWKCQGQSAGRLQDGGNWFYSWLALELILDCLLREQCPHLRRQLNVCVVRGHLRSEYHRPYWILNC